MKKLFSLIAAAALAGSAAAQMPQHGRDQMPNPGTNQMYQQGGYGAPQQQPVHGQQGYGHQGFAGPGSVNYSSLGGKWHMTFNGQNDPAPVAAQVDAQGQFMVRIGSVTWHGQFNGMVGQGVSTSPKRNGRGMDQFPIRLQFDGQCHIQVQGFLQTGQPIGQPVFVHVNHLAGQPCPQ